MATAVVLVNAGFMHSLLLQQHMIICMQRLAYFPPEAAKELSKYSVLLALDARLPVAMFGYK